jgi:type IV pilus assembly protein PilX
MMQARSTTRKEFARATQQRGVVLFFALIALVVMSLAAVALIRSVDTSTMIAGNLAFRQSAATSADNGSEAAINWLGAERVAMDLAGKVVYIDITHSSNVDNPAAGYYSNVRMNSDLTDGTFAWSNATSALALPDPDASGNTVRYIVERMCRTANVIPQRFNCLFTPLITGRDGSEVILPDGVCSGPGCPLAQGLSPQLRITARVTGPKNTVSYIQTFVY